MQDKKTKQNSLRKIAFILLFAFSFSLAPLPARKAEAWTAIGAAILNAEMKTLLEQIEKMLVGTIKAAAIKASDQMINKMVGGGSGSGPMFITDWQDYLIQQPARNTQLRMNNILTRLTQNKGSISGYVPNKAFEGTGPGAFNTGMSQYGNYFSRLVAETQSSLGGAVSPPTYQGNPAQMFAKGYMKDLSTYVSGNNSPWPFKWNALAKEWLILGDEKNKYMTKANSGSGFIGKEVDGITVTPGITIKDALSNSRDNGNRMIIAANSVSEVVMAAAIKTVTATIEEGIGNVQSQVQKQINDVTRNNAQMQNAVRTGGPGALYQR